MRRTINQRIDRAAGDEENFRKMILKDKFVLLLCGGLMIAMGACTSDKFKTPEKLGGKWVSAETLNVGHDTYMQYCYQCHGVMGDGNGPAAQGTYPPPRDFKQGLFKFGTVAAGNLPTDDDLKKTILYGLRGTPMLPWDISEKRLDAVVQYIKTFSPAWKEQEIGEPLIETADPWGPKLASEAIKQGEKVYHGLAQCYTCHPSYVGLEKINQYSIEMTGNPVSEIRDSPELSTPLETSYNYIEMPPDYTKNFIKTGGGIHSLYQILGTGIGGTPMPAWKNALSVSGDLKESEKNQWALAYYVNYLYSLKFNEEARRAFLKKRDKEISSSDLSNAEPETKTESQEES